MASQFLNQREVTILYDTKQSFVSTISSKAPLKHGKVCIGYYRLKILGMSEKATSISDVRLCVKIDGKWIEGERTSVYLEPAASQAADKHLSIQVFYPTTQKYIYVGFQWEDIRATFDKRIEYAGVVSGDALFMFSQTFDQIKNASKLMFIVVDNFGTEYRSVLENNLTDFNGRLSYVIDYPLAEAKKLER